MGTNKYDLFDVNDTDVVLKEDGDTVVKSFKTASAAHRWCDLLNAACELAGTGHKSNGLSKPPGKVVVKKA